MIDRNPLRYLLGRYDKWFLGGEGRLIWTPLFPKWLEYPGFWDEAHYYNFEIVPVFTWTLLDEDGRRICLRAFSFREWSPVCLKVDICSEKLNISEVKVCLQDNSLISIIGIASAPLSEVDKVHLIAWTAQRMDDNTWISDIDILNCGIKFVKNYKPSGGGHFKFDCILGLYEKIDSFSINVAQSSEIVPLWESTPFFEKFMKGLQNEFKIEGVDRGDLIYMGVHREIKLRGDRTSTYVIFKCMGYGEGSSVKKFTISPLSKLRKSEIEWRKFLNMVPYFKCSDEHLTNYYWYRWYGLRLFTIREGDYRHPVVCEGPGYFRAPISYSAVCHMLETRWMHTPELTRGIFLTFVENQRDDGSFPGYIDVNSSREEIFYHSNWGYAVMELEKVHPDANFLSRIYDNLVRYARYFDRERDAEGSGLYDIWNQYESGQEYMHRYVAVNKDVDRASWGKIFRLKGVDSTVYIYELKKALSKIAEKLGKVDESDMWKMEAERIKRAILEKMWDKDLMMFFDIDPLTGEKIYIKSATCFYPYMTDIVSEEHIDGLKKHLFNPAEFWTPFPVPSSACNDKYFSAYAEWKGKRMNCPWNGRVWPMTNSHIAEALARTAMRFDDIWLRGRTAEFILKFIKMMFFDGDPKKPNCFEHYNPFNGKPSIYRGVDDYQHSWIVDLIIKYVAGIYPEERAVIVDPYPFGLGYFMIENVKVRGQNIRVKMQDDRFTVWVGRKKYGSSLLGEPIILDI